MKRKPFRMDAITAAYNFDAAESMNVENELLIVRTRLYEVRYPELKATSFVPAEAQRLDPGANSFTYDFVTHYSDTPKLHTGMSRRGPRAEVKKERGAPLFFVSKTNSYGYDLQDIRAAAYSKFPLDQEKAKAARKIVEFWRDDVLLIADGTATWDGLYGLFKLPNTLMHTVSTGAALSKRWATKTAIEVLNDMHAICNEVITNSNGVESPDTLLLALSAYLEVSTRKMGDGDNRTILEAFLAVRQKMRPGFQVDFSVKLETAAAASVDGSQRRMVAYEKTAEKVARLDSVEFEQLQPQVEAFETITDCHSRTAGVYSAYPKSIAYGDNH